MYGSSLRTGVTKADSTNYTNGRSAKVSKIVIHHGATTSLSSIGAVFQQPNRNGSAHYGVGEKKIIQYVDENNTAWHASNWDINSLSIGIETTNSTGCVNNNDSDKDSWKVSDISLRTLITLVADIGKRYSLGTLVPGENVTWHSLYANTFCPGNYLRSKIEYICKEANEINNMGQLVITDIDNKKIELINDCTLWDLDFTSYPNAKSIKKYKKGTIIEASAIADHPLGSKYYLSEYSYSKGIKNGFNVVNCKDYVEESGDNTTENDSDGVNSSETSNQDETPTETETSENEASNEETSNVIIKLFKVVLSLVKNIFIKKD